MARPLKKGIDYFPFDVSFYQDRKIRKIKRSCGLNSISILILLLCNIYRDCGYYILSDEDMRFDVADELGTSVAAVDEFVKVALSVGFFEKNMYDKHNILTSAAIQKRYLKAVVERTEVELIKDYLLVEVPKNVKAKFVIHKNEVFPRNNEVFPPNNPINPPDNPQRKGKERKVYESNSVSTPDGAEDIQLDPEEEEEIELKYAEDSFEMKAVEYLINKISKLDSKRKLPDTVEKKQSWAEHIDKIKRLDKRTEDEIRSVLKFATEDDFWQKNILSTMKFRKQFSKLYIEMNSKIKQKSSPATPKKNKFHNFIQHDYQEDYGDFEEIARKRFEENLKRLKINPKEAHPEKSDANE